MSTVQSYDYDANAEQARRLREEAERRRAEYERLRRVAIENQRLEESARVLLAQGRQLAARQGQRLEDLVRDHAALKRQLFQLGREVEGLNSMAREAAATIACQRRTAESCVSQLGGLMRATEAELDHLVVSARDAERSHEMAGQAARQGLENVARWDALVTDFQTYHASYQELETQLTQGERELGLVFHSEAADIAAMGLLLAMEENGYTLREVEQDGPDGGAVSYFEQGETQHALAVRVTRDARRAATEQAWSLLAETFGVSGNACLGMLDDFETAFDAQDLGRLCATPDVRVFPKDETGRQPQGQGRLRPPLHAREHQ